MSPELLEWLIFFKRAHEMTEEEVKQTIHTPAVLAAFERIKLANLPEDVLKRYLEEDAMRKKLAKKSSK